MKEPKSKGPSEREIVNTIYGFEQYSKALRMRPDAREGLQVASASLREKLAKIKKKKEKGKYKPYK